MSSSSSSSSTKGSATPHRKLDNNTDPSGTPCSPTAPAALTARCAELLQRDIDDVYFKFDDKEEAYRGCAKLKQTHDKVSAGIVLSDRSS